MILKNHSQSKNQQDHSPDNGLRSSATLEPVGELYRKFSKPDTIVFYSYYKAFFQLTLKTVK